MTLYPWRWVSSLVSHETRIEDTSLEPALPAPYQSVYRVMAGKASSDQCVPAVESRKRKGKLTSKQCAFRITTRLTQEPAETEMSGNTQRSRPNGSSPSARSTEVLEETGRSSVPKRAHSPKSDNPSCSQTGTAPPSWKDVLRLAIWRLLPPEHPGLSPTEVHDRLREQEHELLEHQHNPKSLQSAIYAALNEMMIMYVDRRRPKAAESTDISRYSECKKVEHKSMAIPLFASHHLRQRGSCLSLSTQPVCGHRRPRGHRNADHRRPSQQRKIPQLGSRVQTEV
jgi:hypothetical protein